MPLIDCVDCGKAISDAAEACIHCGRPLRIQDTEPVVLCANCQRNGSEVQLVQLKEEDVSSAVGCSSIILGVTGVALLFGVWPLGVAFIVGGVLVYSLSKKHVKIRYRCPKCHKWGRAPAS